MDTPTPPSAEPIALQLTRASKAISRAFDDALKVAGGSLPIWLILRSLKAQRHAAQGEIAAAVGVEGPTLTHHLNRMEADGLITRRRDPENRRVHRVELTNKGNASFRRLVSTVTAFDEQLRNGFTKREIDALGKALVRLRTNVDG